MTPYYEHAGITIYHGDCRDVIDQWEGLRIKPFDLLLTDPPYGLGRDVQAQSSGSHGGRKAYAFADWDASPPSPELLISLCRLAKIQIIWGGNYFWLPPSQKWLIWDKGQRIDQSDGELAWTSMAGALRIFVLNRVELMRDGAVHPTQKPEALLRWCIREAGDPQVIFDPFMGSGSTCVAAKRLGLRAVGIEQHERYCEIATRRLSQEVLPLAGAPLSVDAVDPSLFD